MREPAQITTEKKEALSYATPAGREQTKREFELALRAGTVIRSKGAKIRRTNAALLQQLVEQARQRA